MKRIIAILLMPITPLIILFKKVIEIAYAIGQPVTEGVTFIVESNYNFWKRIFKWKESE
jgi:hypothetical protein